MHLAGGGSSSSVGVHVGVTGVDVGVVGVADGVPDVVAETVGEGVRLGSRMINGGNETPSLAESGPGVRNESSQPIGVRMSNEIGCSKPGSFFEAVSGSRLDCIPPSTRQLGTRRIAICPAINIRTMPIGSKKMIRVQSRRSCLVEFAVILFRLFFQWERDKEDTPRIGLFIVARAFDPDPAAVRLDDTTGNGEPQTGTAALELCLAGRMQKHFAGLIELVEDQGV